jgi:hypothetical protein
MMDDWNWSEAELDEVNIGRKTKEEIPSFHYSNTK